ncbi:metal-sensitive transcriptional regulator [Corynebacterium sp. zg-331]|uniref:metal-sensitive transcriptional regulator n=1 Tax=unclassified Corynebacterium TaxID=2624378 RepID=UPI00128BAE0E|nr:MULTISPECIES: metal-sensitive transcriptional regulator [unclassified Corynebacterium]MBC3186964.1 metal-sensitive transcriptional regulator [Corynebacterium sp. zg-331]MPV53441.1 metal-sensing transcriptional repressor [Corynebacterium sp. zg331]
MSTQHGYHEAKDAYLTRLKRIEGQVRGVRRMIEEDTYCIDVVTQISAATAALHTLSVALMSDHLHHCVADALTEGRDGGEKIDEAMKAIGRMVKS